MTKETDEAMRALREKIREQLRNGEVVDLGEVLAVNHWAIQNKEKLGVR